MNSVFIYTTAVEPAYASFVEDDTAYRKSYWRLAIIFALTSEGEAKRGAMQEFLFLIYGVCFANHGAYSP